MPMAVAATTGLIYRKKTLISKWIVKEE